ncbi:MAG: hypothetical protein GY870_16380, partial [archaeon]|nr:hypothetical protein [archaeon]
LKEILVEIRTQCKNNGIFRKSFNFLMDELINIRSEFENDDEIEIYLKNMRVPEINEVHHDTFEILQRTIDILKNDSKIGLEFEYDK